MKKYTDTYRKNRVPEYGMDAASSDVSTGGASDRRSGLQYSGSKSMQSLKDCGRTEKTSKKGQAFHEVRSTESPQAYRHEKFRSLRHGRFHDFQIRGSFHVGREIRCKNPA